MSILKGCLAGTLAVACSASAGAAPLTLTNPVTDPYQMTSQNPCIIGGDQCNAVEPAGFAFTVLPTGGGSQTYDATATYTGQQILDFIGTSFFVGIDVNSTRSNPATEDLEFFGVYVNNVLLYEYGTIGGAPTPLYITNKRLIVGNGKGATEVEVPKIDDVVADADASRITIRASELKRPMEFTAGEPIYLAAILDLASRLDDRPKSFT